MWCLLVSLTLFQGEATTYKIAGPRQARATVQQDGEVYEVKARMLAVTAFDEATNARLNRQKAEHLALTVLARHLTKEKTAQIEVTGARVSATAKEGKLFALTLRVPARGVQVVRAESTPASPPAGTVRVALDHPFLTRKTDLLDTLKTTYDGLDTDLTSALRAAGKSKESMQKFLLVLTELEERGNDFVAPFQKEIDGREYPLLKLERDEVSAELARRQKAWRQALEAAAQKVERTEKDT